MANEKLRLRSDKIEANFMDMMDKLISGQWRNSIIYDAMDNARKRRPRKQYMEKMIDK